MAENLNLNINVNTSGTEVIGNLRKDIKEANTELLKAQTLYGDYSKEAINAAKKVAELRDKIQEARETADLFDPGKKFQAFTGVLTTVAGGFGAVQGAMALFGKESEEVQKTLLKVQSAMALTQGLSTIRDGAKDFERLGTIIKMNVVTAFSTLRGAIIATGFGALAVAIGLLIANFNEFTEYIKNSFPQLFKFAETIGNVVQKITDFVGITSEAKRESDEWVKAIGKITKALDNQIAELEAQGGREDEVYKLKRQRLEYQLQAIKGNSEKEIEERADLNSKLRILDIQEEKRKQLIIEQEKAEIEKYNEWLLNQDLILYEKRKEQYKKLNLESIGSDGMTNSERKKKEEDDAKAKADAEKAMQEFNENSEKNGLGKILAIRAAADAQSIKDAEDTAAAKKRIDELEKESKEATAYAIADITAGISNILGQETAAGKAIAIASATIDTYLSASTIFKQASKNPITVVNPAYPYLMAAPAVLSGIARVKQIASVSVPRGGGSSAGVPNISSAAPMPPQLPMAQTTNISQQSINDIGNQAVRAYVIESDVTSNQQRMAAIRQRARFS
jgi:hypothetical protein